MVVAAMGNCNSSTPQYPAAFTNTIAVGATDTDDSRCNSSDWSWPWDEVCGSVHGSNYGSHIDVVAPGNEIYSTKWNNTYSYMSGTSMATPFVSGLAAMIMSRSWPEPSPDSVRQIIRSTADDTVGLPSEDTPGWDQYHGWGRINAAKALGVPTPIFAEDFNDCDISDWTVYTSSGTFATTNSQYVSPPCGLYMCSQASGYAYGNTPDLEVDTTQDFTITTYFKVTDTDNHWFMVLDNNWVHLVIDEGTDLRAWQGSHGGILPIATLNTNQWYYIKTVVHPATSNYDIYLNCYHYATANFLRGGAGNVYPYLRLGDIHNGATDHGEAYWDDLMVYGQKSYLCGDVNDDGVIDIGDVVYLISYLYRGGPAPNPLEAGDCNSDGVVNLGDVVYLISYLYRGGPPPCSGKVGSSSGHAEVSLLGQSNPANENLTGFAKASPASLDEVSEISVIGKFNRDVAGVHLEIDFNPNEVTLLDPVLTPLTKGLQLFSGIEDGTQKIGIVDLSGKNVIKAGEGILVNLRAKGKDLTSIKIKKALLVDMNATPLSLEVCNEMSKGSESTPRRVSLSQNCPNPFNPATSIQYSVGSSQTPVRTTLKIYNLLGQLVRTLVDEEMMPGNYKVIWDGKDEKGDQVSSGIYFYRLEADKFSEAKKMILMK